MVRSARKIVLCLILSLLLVPSFSYSDNTRVHAEQVTAPGHQLQNGVTQPTYSYVDAIKETIFVESALDSDENGEPDRIAIDIMRPKETEEGLKVPVIMDASPYYERLGRGNESQVKDPDGDGINDVFPLFYDNYFVPRGYAVVLVDMVGTNNSDGCPTTGGYEETESVKVAIEWLNGKGKAWDKDGNEVKADWSTGKVGMIGKSYDGTLANAVAATGVEGLETIVPIGAISSWYYYYRYEGILFSRNGPGGLASRVTNSKRVQQCAPIREKIRVAADDDTGNYNEFWAERNYYKDADKVKASVFVIHGLNDYNVKANHFSKWWEALAENDVPRKLWLTQTGHVDPFDFRRAEWVDTLHRWFDYWLLGIENGIMDEPMVDLETGPGEWETHSNWPDENSKVAKLRLAPGAENLPGTLTTGPVNGNDTQTFTDNPNQTDTQMVQNEFTVKEDRLIFLSPELKEDVRLSGVPEIDIRSVVDKENANLTGLIVDYGTDVRVNHQGSGEGIKTLSNRTCWGESSPSDSACYRETEITTVEAPYEIVTHGWLSAKNRKSLEYAVPLEPGKNHRMKWDTLPEDYVFKKGHRIGIVIAGSNRGRLLTDPNRATFHVHLGQSLVELPIVGGRKALEKAFGETNPANAAEIITRVENLKKDGEFKSDREARSLTTHMAAVELYEKKGLSDKIVKHMNGFIILLAHQEDQGLISKKGYYILKEEAESLIEKWE
ncbi:Xaa-Pro dipeptidyl-peptidase [Siminovitchia sp. 179-K 8D1 HS]|uniref:Xaa-Pro dipeptidyl-peptidase n=1 Tax=Siminovitchia sp. 179-K 8D1 HS TaxID=3142385 RepID=UPI0039A07A32